MLGNDRPLTMVSFWGICRMWEWVEALLPARQIPEGGVGGLFFESLASALWRCRRAWRSPFFQSRRERDAMSRQGDGRADDTPLYLFLAMGSYGGRRSVWPWLGPGEGLEEEEEAESRQERGVGGGAILRPWGSETIVMLQGIQVCRLGFSCWASRWGRSSCEPF